MLPEVAAADGTLGEEGSDDEDEGMRIMLQASAALEVARIQRNTRVESPAGAGGWNSKQASAASRSSLDSFDEESFEGSGSFTTYTLENDV